MKTCKDCIHYDVCLGAFGDYLIKTCNNFKDKSKFIEFSHPISGSNYLYIIPTIDRSVKVIFENEVFIEDNGDMSLSIRRPATLFELAEYFDMPIGELISTKFGIYKLE